MEIDGCRVVQWATGNIGTHALRSVVEHPQLSLSGVYVHSAEKAGRDAGELCGLGSTGVSATRDINEIIRTGADCVLYMPLVCDIDEVCALLAAGMNIVTTCGEFRHPASMDDTTRRSVETACLQGNSSIHSTGSSPGFISEALPLTLTSIQRRLDNLTIDEYANLSQRDTPDILFGVMGFGGAPTAVDERRTEHIRSNFGPSLRLIADALAVPLDSVEASAEFACARHTTTIAAGTIDEGTLAAQRITVSGMRLGEPLLCFRATWYCTTELDPDWDVRATGWHVAVHGDAPLDIDLRFPVALEDMAAVTPGYTANRAVNAVPGVCAADAGIRSTHDLPHVVATLG